MQDRFYIAVRNDLTPGQQLSQAVHAALQFSQEQPEKVSSWYEDSNYLVVVSTDEEGLYRAATKAIQYDIAYTVVREPDIDDQVTAVAFQPGDTARRICAQFPLALREKTYQTHVSAGVAS